MRNVVQGWYRLSVGDRHYCVCVWGLRGIPELTPCFADKAQTYGITVSIYGSLAVSDHQEHASNTNTMARESTSDVLETRVVTGPKFTMVRAMAIMQ